MYRVVSASTSAADAGESFDVDHQDDDNDVSAANGPAASGGTPSAEGSEGAACAAAPVKAAAAAKCCVQYWGPLARQLAAGAAGSAATPGREASLPSTGALANTSSASAAANSSGADLRRAAANFARIVVLLEAGQAADRRGDAAEAMKQLSSALALADAHKAAAAAGTSAVGLGAGHILRLRLLAALLKACIDGGDWLAALQAARQLTTLYEQVGWRYRLFAKRGTCDCGL